MLDSSLLALIVCAALRSALFETGEEPASFGPPPPSPEASWLGFAPAPSAPFSEAALADLQGAGPGVPPRYWIAVGYHYTNQNVDAPGLGEHESDPTTSVQLGLYNWSGEMGFGIEAAYLRSTYTVRASSLLEDEIDAERFQIGLRLADTQSTESWMFFARGGYQYRTDDGSQAGDDQGSGFYVGGGLEYRLGRVIGIAPQVLYTQSSSFESEEWLVGVELVAHL